jgi:hypothetical protein
MNTHLTRRQMDEWMIGDRPDEVKIHLESCPQCRDGLAELEAPLGAFRDAVHGWSARQMGPATAVQPRGLAAGWLRIAVAGVALAVIAAVGIHRYDQQAAAAIAKEDDALLDQIATDVSRSVPVTLEPLARLMSSSNTEGAAQ